MSSNLRNKRHNKYKAYIENSKEDWQVNNNKLLCHKQTVFQNSQKQLDTTPYLIILFLVSKTKSTTRFRTIYALP